MKRLPKDTQLLSGTRFGLEPKPWSFDLTSSPPNITEETVICISYHKWKVLQKRCRIHPFNRYVLSAYYVPGTVLAAMGTYKSLGFTGTFTQGVAVKLSSTE